MSLSLTRQPWMDAPVAPHPIADALAAAVRPRDLASPPRLEKTAPWLSPRTLTIVVAGHAALLVVAALTWRAVLPAGGETIQEIPVEIVIEATSDARSSIAEPVTAQAEAARDMATPSAAESVMSAVPEAQTETMAQPADGGTARDPRAVAEPSAPQDSAPADTRLAEMAAQMQAQRAAQADQERRDAAAHQRAKRLAQERAAQIAEERADIERERRAQAKRAAERDLQAQAAQDRRRMAARSLGVEQTQRAAPAFDAAGYRAIVARTVSAATSRSCSAGGGGRVVVALMIGPSGRVASASLSSASGNSMLDAAALGAVRRAGPFPAPSNHASVSVPVVVICR